MSLKKKTSILNKNILETKLLGIYSCNQSIPQIEFKKINDYDYLYGTMKIIIKIDVKNPNIITGKL